MKPDPAKLAKALSSRIEKKTMREGLSTWLTQLAQEKSSRRITNRMDLLAFLSEAPGASLRVVLKDSLQSEAGFALGARITDEGFVLSDEPLATRNARPIKYSQVALYQLLGTDRIASG